MIPNTSAGLTTTGTMVDEERGMMIDENSLEFIQSVLIDLYNDPILACIREYSTNAFDAHVMADQTRPVEVSLPTDFKPEFVVEDFGIGMSRDDIVNTYTKYGASSKRNSNKVTGMLGLGSKSALTYTNQFTVRAVRDERETVVLISRKDNGEAVYNIVHEGDTTDPNGVRISIPVTTDFNKWQYKVNQFYCHWPKGSVLINGSAPGSFLDTVNNPIKVSDNIYVWPVTGYSDPSSKVVMGNVAYDANFQEYMTVGTDYNKFAVYYIASMDPAEVNFSPNRESLQYTPKTLETIKRVAKEIEENLAKEAIASIEDALSLKEAHGMWLKWRNRLGKAAMDGIHWKDVELVQDVMVTKATIFNPDATRYAISHLHDTHYTASALMNNTIFIKHRDNREITPAMRKRIRYYCDTQVSETVYRVFLFDGEVDNSDYMLNPVDWEEIEKIEIPRTYTNPNTANRRVIPKGQWDYWTNSKTYPLTGEIDPDYTIYYASPRDLKGNDDKERSRTYFTSVMGDDAILVSVAANRQAKFQKDYPEAVHYTIGASNIFNDFVAKMDMVAYRFSHVDYWTKRRLAILSEHLPNLTVKPLDPRLQTMLDLYNKYRDSMRDIELKTTSYKRLAGYFNIKSSALNSPSEPMNLDWMDEDYPLWDDAHPEHSVKYMNLIYEGK